MHAFLGTFGTESCAQSVIINKNFCIGAQSEVYEECVVGWVKKTETVLRDSCLRTINPSCLVGESFFFFKF